MDRNRLIKAIWAISKQLGIDKDELHILLERETKKESMRRCSEDELKKLLKVLDFFKAKDEIQKNANRLSPAQKKYIEDLAVRLGWHGEPHRLKAFIKRNTGVEDINWLTPRHASNIIEGLKNMITQRDAKAELEAEALTGAEANG